MIEVFKRLRDAVAQSPPDPLMRRALGAVVALAMFVFALALYAPALGSARFVYGTDTVSHDYIMHYYGWVKSVDALGQVPLWNPYLFSGLPMLASAALCPFYPTQWLYLLLPFNMVFTLQYVFAVALGGVGTAWWIRCLGLRRSIAVWAGFMAIVSGHFLTLTYAGHLQKMIAIGWSPVALGATIQLVRVGISGVRGSARYRSAALLGVALGMQLLASHPQIFYATLLACALQLLGMAALMVWRRARGQVTTVGGAAAPPVVPDFRPLGQAIGMIGLALVVCVLLSAVQLFPTWEMSSLSNRSGGVEFTEAVETSYPPLEVLEYVVPRAFGDSVIGTTTPYFGQWGERIVSDYLGLPLMLLAALGALGSRRRYRWYLVTLFLLSLLVGFGRYTPLYWLLYHVMPGFDNFRSPGTYMFLANFALIGLAAMGLDYLLKLAASVNEKGWNSALERRDADDAATTDDAAPPLDETQPFDAEAALEADAGLEYNGTDTPTQNPQIDYDADYAPAAESVYSSNFTWDREDIPWLGRPAMLLFLAAVGVASLIGTIIALAEVWDVNLTTATVAERKSHNLYSSIANVLFSFTLLVGGILLLRLRAWVGGVAIALLAFVFPLCYNYYFLRFEPLPPYMAHLTQQQDLLNLAKTGQSPVRVLEENLLKNEAMLHGVGSPAGYHPVMSARYADAVDSLGVGSDAFGALYHIQYARTTGDDPPRDGNWVENSRHAGANNRDSVTWRRAQPGPYFFENAELHKVDTDDITLTSASLREIGMGMVAAATGPDQPLPAPNYVARVSEYDLRRYRLYEGPQMAEAIMQRWGPHEIRFHTRAGTPDARSRALLPLAEPMAPGWKAETSAGRALPVIAVNGLQRGVVLPDGELNVRLVYKPYALRLGLFVSLMSGVILASFAMGSVARRFIKGQKRVRKAMRRAHTTQNRFPQMDAMNPATEEGQV